MVKPKKQTHDSVLASGQASARDLRVQGIDLAHALTDLVQDFSNVNPLVRVDLKVSCFYGAPLVTVTIAL
jgi:hypothetical protein